jgi:NADH-quinone oxidoreductase subunit A
MTNGYLPILVFGGLVFLFATLSIAVSALLSPHRPRPAKSAPYECGITPERLPAAERYPVKFYVIAMLFIIFDVEAIFLYPWAVAFRSLGLFGLVEMIVFIGLLFVAYLYVLQKGGLEWETLDRPAPAGGEIAGRAATAGPPDGGDAGDRPVREPAVAGGF